MAPKQDHVYVRGRSMFVTPYTLLVIGSDDERECEYVPPSSATLLRSTCATRATPKKVASGVVTASHSDDEHTLTGTFSGSATYEDGASSFLGVSWSEEASWSAEVLHLAQLHSLSRLIRLTVLISLPSHRLVLSPRLPTSTTGGVSTGQYQFYSDAKFLNDKEVMTRTLT